MIRRKIANSEIEAIRPHGDELLIFQDNLRERREELGLRQVDIAEMLDISLSTYARLENGSDAISELYYLALYVAFNQIERGLPVDGGMDIQSFRDRLERIRNTYGLSAENIATFIGMSRKGYWNLENGNAKFRLKHFLAINAAINRLKQYLASGYIAEPVEC